jgi:hypothetical protein
MKTIKTCLACVLCLTCIACAPAHPGEGFNKRLQLEVGKNLRDPTALRNRYQSRKVRTHDLANGNVEEEYFPGDRCTFFIEVNPVSNKIVAARVDKYEKYCDIP